MESGATVWSAGSALPMASAGMEWWAATALPMESAGTEWSAGKASQRRRERDRTV